MTCGSSGCQAAREYSLIRPVPCQNSHTAADLAFHALGHSAVFADQTAGNLPSLDPGGDIDSVDGLPLRGFLLPALVRTVPAVVPGVLGRMLRRCRSPRTSTWSRHSRRSVPTNRSA